MKPPPLKRRLGSPGAVRDRPGLHRRLDLLLDRPGGGARARAHVGGVPGRRRAVRGDRALLRRGRLAAPGARRRDRDRPLRVQRARELHRRLGDLPRLPDPRRALRVRVHGLPGRVLERVQRGRQRVPDRLGDRALRRAAWRSAAPARAASSAPRCSCSATSCCRCSSSCSAWRCCSTPRCSPTRRRSPARPTLEDIDLRVPARAGRLQRHRRVLRPRRAGGDRPRAACGG